MDCRTGSGFCEQGVQIAKVFLEFAKLARVAARRSVVDRERELRFLLLELGLEDLPCSGNGVALVVEQAFDAQCHFDISTAIETLAGTAFVRLELGKLAFPEAQDVGGNVAEFGDVADAKVKLVRNVRPGCWSIFTDWLVLRHARDLRYRFAGVAYGPA